MAKKSALTEDTDELRERIAKLESSKLPTAEPYVPKVSEAIRNPNVRQLANEHPKAFAGFTKTVWKQIYADQRDYGRALTREEVVDGLEVWQENIEDDPSGVHSWIGDDVTWTFANLEATAGSLPVCDPPRNELAFERASHILELLEARPRIFAGFNQDTWNRLASQIVASGTFSNAELIEWIKAERDKIERTDAERQSLVDTIAELENTDLPDADPYYPSPNERDHNPAVARMFERNPRIFAGFDAMTWRIAYAQKMTREDVLVFLKQWRERPYREETVELSDREKEIEIEQEIVENSSDAEVPDIGLTAFDKQLNPVAANLMEKHPRLFGGLAPQFIRRFFGELAFGRYAANTTEKILKVISNERSRLYEQVDNLPKEKRVAAQIRYAIHVLWPGKINALARKAGVSVAALNVLKREGTTTPTSTLRAVCAALGITPKAVLEEEFVITDEPAAGQVEDIFSLAHRIKGTELEKYAVAMLRGLLVHER